MESNKRKRDENDIGNANAKEKKVEGITKQQIRKLEKDCINDKKNLNNIVEIFTILKSSSDDEIIHTTIVSLKKIFSHYLPSILTFDEKSNDKKKMVNQWLKDNYANFISYLLTLFENDEPAIQIITLKTLFEFIKHETTFFSLQKGFLVINNKIFIPTVKAILLCQNLNKTFYDALLEQIDSYDDLRYYFLKAVETVVNNSANVKKAKKNDEKSDEEAYNVSVNTLYSLISEIQNMPMDDSQIETFFILNPAELKGDSEEKVKHPLLTVKGHNQVFGDAWLAFLRLPLTVPIYKRVLLIINKRIIPFMTNPVRLIDFLTDAYNEGGAISLLALNGLFTLMNEHNLDYPEFFTKLYALFDNDLMHIKYRSRFFRLVDLFFTSSHMPAYIVAAFIKKMARLALYSPPSGVVIVIPLIYSLMKRHPSCMVMIHREGNLKTDKFDMNEKDPLKSGAMESSLWELNALRKHYFGDLASLGDIFTSDFKKEPYDLEDFLDQTYSTFVESELNKKVKKSPATAIMKSNITPSIFTDYCSLWGFPDYEAEAAAAKAAATAQKE
ncbi:CBF-domain-containing protein [Piromyces finnis]|uniref:CBF-domain-containing protein n=1 Tax=Piromyces finnis TaxID=1754191 RepID=A0A1Y1VK30_9FUNG|nr:CBF-domain-containing protein [Piromyces finnis]|eukprot:ORX57140.1 CBF-domain-containing protein [Piromyces finnis]